jgi:hypothetical protein
MKCGVQKIIKVGGIIAIIMGAVSLHAWWCTDCKKAHEDPFCPETCKDKDGLTPSDCQSVGNLPNGVPVHHTPYGVRAPNGQAVQKIGERYLYELLTSFGSSIYYDGVNNAYNENDEGYPTVGLTADGNLVFQHADDPQKLFAIHFNKYTTIVKTKDSRFLYGKPRYQGLSNSKDVYFDGFEYVDLEGNTYERSELKICRDTRD